jgi:hypothetical protein
MIKEGSKVYETFSACYGSRILQNQLRELKVTFISIYSTNNPSHEVPFDYAV